MIITAVFINVINSAVKALFVNLFGIRNAANIDDKNAILYFVCNERI